MRETTADGIDAVTRSLVIAAWVGAPDLAPTTRGRTTLKLALVAGTAAAMGATAHARSAGAVEAGHANESGSDAAEVGAAESGPVEPEGLDVGQVEPDQPGTAAGMGRARIALLAGGGLALMGASHLATRSATRRGAAWLAGRGVGRPWLVVGGVAGLITLLGDADVVVAALRREAW